MKEKEESRRVKAVIESEEEVVRAALWQLVRHADVLEPKDILVITTMALIESIRNYSEVHGEDAKELAQCAIDGIREEFKL